MAGLTPFETSGGKNRSTMMTAIECARLTDRKFLPDTALHVFRECGFLARSLVPAGKMLRRRLTNGGGPPIDLPRSLPA